ncbi:VQ motif-containing protein [Actinidia chinensis var. chinensis]|uniref:VQ motif-containing protein n=1 Tax=Actinidia chinensis var. chinensis TaxID=1590841 RepID=A0A2R6PRS2_ACTCC|nr:VQ motif-containing protein [Actinidia chinensis var. chinensis]
MEINSASLERENPPPTNSPNSTNGGLPVHTQTPPLTPKPVSRSEPNPYPTTFVQADTTTFKQVVQMLTGSPDTANQASKHSPSDPPPQSSKTHIPPIRKQGFKLYERRNSLRNGFVISPLVPGLGHNPVFSNRNSEILSPSMLNFPSLALSPVTPLIEDPFSKSSPSIGSEEERAIAEKGFYLHPSPRPDSGGTEPRLLPLFPLTSPRVSDASS